MKIKYCERCGLFLGLVNPTKRYCSECKHKMDKESDKKRKKRLQNENARARETKAFPSIGEVQVLADKLGKHYGEVSRMLASGELTYER